MKLIKKMLVFFVAVIAFVFTLASCQEPQPQGPTAEMAAKRIMLPQDKQVCNDDFQVPAVVVLEGVTFTVTWVSDNEIVSIVDLNDNYKKVVVDYKNNKDSEQTVSLTATVSNGTDNFKKKFTIKVSKYEETGLLKDYIRNPEFGVEYLLGMPQTAKNEVYYFTGEMSGYYGATQNNKNKGTLVKLVETTGGFYVTFEVNGTTNYINGVKSGSYLNFVFGTEPSNVWTWNAEYCTPVTTIEDTEVFMGTSDNYVTFGMMKVEELGKSTVYAGTLYKKPENYGADNDEVDVEALVTTPVATPEVGVEYILGMNQTAKGAHYYFTGAMSGYYGATETDYSKAIAVKLVATTGGYHLTFEVNGTTNYINGVKSGNYLNFVFGTEASNVWTWNAEYKTLVTTIEDIPVFMGTSGNYVTYGMMKVEELGKSTVYCGQLFKKPTENVGPAPEDLVTTPIATPEVDVEYLLGMNQTAKGAHYYFTGAMSGYYGATETDYTKGIAVKLVATAGGYYLTFTSNGTTNYINGVKSGNYLNFVFGTEASNVWTWNAEYKTLVTTIEDIPVFMGTSGNYVTYGMMKVEELGKSTVYCGQLFKKPSSSNQGNGNVNVDTSKEYTIAEALAMGAKLSDGEMTETRILIRATVESIKDYTYGGMQLTDETGTISVYGSYSADGTKRYGEMTDKPLANYEVLVSCILKNFKGTTEINSAWILEFEQLGANFDEADYTEMTIAQARDKAVNSKVKVTGVVAKITYAFGMKPSGFYLVDGTNSIYVYDSQLAPRVKEGDKLTICASRANWILEDEQTSAAKFGYTGCIQLDKAYLVGDIESNNSVDLSWVEESTVKQIMDTPVSTNITTTIYKVNAYVKKVDGTGFVNYYIDDIDGKTGSYCYTQCSGSDFAWLDQFDGKICTVYLSAINAKSSKSACVWRFIPVAVKDEGYTFDLADSAEYALTYHAVDQFLAKYSGNPQRELLTTVSNADLGVENVQLSYASDNTNIVYFTTTDGKVYLNCQDLGTATVTITATYGSVTAAKTVTITVVENPASSALTVKQAIETEVGVEVTVKGIVGPSLVNKVGFYLMDNETLIAIETTEEQMLDLEIGNFVVVKGVRFKNKKDATSTTGQTCINNAEIIANEYGKNELPTSYIQDITGADFNKININEDHTTELYRITGKVSVVESAYYTNLNFTAEDGTAVLLYMASAGQYRWLTDAIGNETATFVVAPCNWNSKTDKYRGCVLFAIKADGTIVYNTLNFSN